MDRVRWLASIVSGSAQVEGRLQLAVRTPAVRTFIVEQEARAMAVGPEFRLILIPNERRLLVPASEYRLIALGAENRSIAA